jgi:hypothetical protein
MTTLGNSHGFWFVSLKKSKPYWFDLFVNPLEHESVNTRDAIATDLAEKEEIDRNSEHSRFVYFFASRPRVRVDTTVPFEFDKSSGSLKFQILQGRERIPFQIESQIQIMRDAQEIAYLTCTDRSIRIHISSETSQTVSIHDFLRSIKQPLGHPTEILYVGSTAAQAKRFLKREHRGVSDSIYHQGSESYDFFFYSNLFEVHEILYYEAARTRVVSRKVSLDLKDCKEECSVVENGLIGYFGCKSQDLNRKRESGELRNRMIGLNKKRGISKVAYHVEVDPAPSYFSFFSATAQAKGNHTFLYELNGNKLSISTFPDESHLVEVLSNSDDA